MGVRDYVCFIQRQDEECETCELTFHNEEAKVRRRIGEGEIDLSVIPEDNNGYKSDTAVIVHIPLDVNPLTLPLGDFANYPRENLKYSWDDWSFEGVRGYIDYLTDEADQDDVESAGVCSIWRSPDRPGVYLVNFEPGLFKVCVLQTAEPASISYYWYNKLSGALRILDKRVLYDETFPLPDGSKHKTFTLPPPPKAITDHPLCHYDDLSYSIILSYLPRIEVIAYYFYYGLSNKVETHYIGYTITDVVGHGVETGDEDLVVRCRNQEGIGKTTFTSHMNTAVLNRNSDMVKLLCTLGANFGGVDMTNVVLLDDPAYFRHICTLVQPSQRDLENMLNYSALRDREDIVRIIWSMFHTPPPVRDLCIELVGASLPRMYNIFIQLVPQTELPKLYLACMNVAALRGHIVYVQYFKNLGVTEYRFARNNARMHPEIVALIDSWTT